MRATVQSLLRPFTARAAVALLALVGGGAGLLACWGHLDCEESDQQARTLLAEYGACAAGDSCRALFLPDHVDDATNEWGGICINEFLCSVPLRESADEAAFVVRARDIVSRRRCNTCAFAKCRHPDGQEAFCDLETKRCKLRAIPGPPQSPPPTPPN